MDNILVLTKKELAEQWRTKKLLIMGIVFLFVAVASPIFAKLLPEILKNVSVPGMTIALPAPTYVDSLDQFIKNISQIALLVLVFAVAGAVADEKNNRTLEMLLTKPVSRVSFITAKFMSYFISITAVFIGAALIFYLYTTTTFTAFNFGNFAIMAGAVLLYILMITAVTLLASTIANSTLVAGGLGFIGYVFFGAVFDLIPGIKAYSPSTILTQYKEVASHGWSTVVTGPTILTVILIIIAVSLAILLFRRQEIER